MKVLRRPSLTKVRFTYKLTVKGLNLCDGTGGSPGFLFEDGSLFGVVFGVYAENDRGDRCEDALLESAHEAS